MSSWMQVYQEVKDPPSVVNPPDGWEQALVPSGTQFTFYAYELFADTIDWVTGAVIGRKLTWKRASFFLPAQDFMMMQLQSDNSWVCIQVLKGPILYISMDAPDGDAKVFKLVAA